ncbi:MAG: Hsp20/alpha crystallin family protein [Longimicrobiales bacterium]
MPRDREPRDERSRNTREDARSRSKEVKVSGANARRPTEPVRTRDEGLGLSRAREQNWPFDLRLSDQMSRFFGNFGLGREFVSDRWLPQVDVLRRGEELVVRADLPGLKKEDISVDVADNVLTIRGERREERQEEREGYYWHERRAGSFYRSIPLPEGADAEHARASFSDGVLEITVRAPEEEESRRRHIEIR